MTSTDGGTQRPARRLPVHPGPGRATFCAGIVARNEGAFLKESVESVIDDVDEVIVVENGSVDNTPDVAHELVRTHPAKIRLIELAPESLLADARNAIDDQTRCDWIVWWDADFIAWSHDEAPDRSIATLLERVRDLPGLNQVLYGGPNIGPSFDVCSETKPYQGLTGDTQITRKGLMRFKVEKYIDTRYYTGERRTLLLNKPATPYMLHLDKVKPLARVVLRDLLYKFETSVAADGRNDETFRQWILATNPSFSLAAAKRWLLKRAAQQSRRYDVAAAPHPRILAGRQQQPYFQAQFDDGRVASITQVRAFDADPHLDAYFERLGLA